MSLPYKKRKHFDGKHCPICQSTDLWVCCICGKCDQCLERKARRDAAEARARAFDQEYEVEKAKFAKERKAIGADYSP